LASFAWWQPFGLVDPRGSLFFKMVSRQKNDLAELFETGTASATPSPRASMFFPWHFELYRAPPIGLTPQGTTRHAGQGFQGGSADRSRRNQYFGPRKVRTNMFGIRQMIATRAGKIRQ
jgi:hypothetical protein